MTRADPTDPELFPVTVRGVPALARITHYTPPERGVPTHLRDHPCSPYQAEEIEWVLCDRRGYPAAWLERLADPDDIERQIYAERDRRIELEQTY